MEWGTVSVYPSLTESGLLFSLCSPTIFPAGNRNIE